MQYIRLIATDLDGTIIGNANELPLYGDFRNRIHDLRKDKGTVWAVCTGRSLRTFRDFFSPMQMMGALPDFVIIHHAYIYELTRFGYIPHLLWNLQIHHLLWVSQLSIRKTIDDWHNMVRHFSSGVTTIRKSKDRLWLRFDSESTATAMAAMLNEKVSNYRYLRVFRYPMEVDVRPVPFTKGLALSELADHLGILKDSILAIGNGHNDISMLDGRIAGMTGCPGNSEAEVMAVVHSAGGHIASGSALAGVMEILDAYQKGDVRSALPEDWEDLKQSQNGRMYRPSGRGTEQRPAIKGIVLAMAAAAVVLVFASCNLLPFSRLIMKPYSAAVEILARILAR